MRPTRGFRTARLDTEYHDRARALGFKLKPSDYFRRQCWVSFEPVEATLPFAADFLGPEHILWATDYPHPDGFFPGAPQRIAERLRPEIRRQVMADSALAFYKP